MENDDLTEDEKKMFDELSRSAIPPASLEDKITDRLRAEGEIKGRSVRISFPRLAAGLAAVVVVFMMGWFARTPSVGEDYNYVLLLHQSELFADGDGQSRVREYTEWAASIAKSGSPVTGEKLGESLMVTPSGVTESWESPVSGFFMIRATREQAISIAKGSPHIKYGGSIEVRKIE